MSGNSAVYCLTAWRQWAVELLQHIASLGQRAVELVQRNASPPAGRGQCNACNALPHRLGAVGSGTPAMRGPTSWGDGESCPGGGRC